MSQPAARVGDMTAHGGTIVPPGCPTVLIGGQPAARLTDMHVCPMASPAPVPVPHVGLLILPPCAPTVLIGGLPAARVGDMAACFGPPDVIIPPGCPTVLIGSAGGGGGGGGGGGAGSSATGATMGAVTSTAMAWTGGTGGTETSTQEGHYIQFDFVDSDGNSVGEFQYEFTAPDDSESAGMLGGNGSIYWSGEDAGQGTVKLMFISNARWSEDSARVGDTVTLTADVEGYDPGTPATFEIYKRDVSGADELVTTIEAEVQGSSVETDWEYVRSEENVGESASEGAQRGYSAPEHYFKVTVERSMARSGLLEYRDYVEIQLQDDEGNGIGDQDYVLYLPNGEVREGTLDGSGYKREENVSPGVYSVRFPNLPGFGDVG